MIWTSFLLLVSLKTGSRQDLRATQYPSPVQRSKTTSDVRLVDNESPAGGAVISRTAGRLPTAIH